MSEGLRREVEALREIIHDGLRRPSRPSDGTRQYLFCLGSCRNAMDQVFLLRLVLGADRERV